jgi:aryl-alcohol dehydrogenase-like predicted oxidoreductase
MSEKILGRCIQRRDKELEEQSKEKTNIITATKFIPLPWKLTHGSFKSSLEGSIARLQRKPDLYQVHGPAFSLRRVEVWAEAMVQAVKDGLIKSVGVSNYNADQVRRTHRVLAAHGIPLATNQVEYSLLRNNPEHTSLAQTCKELGVTIIAYSPLGMGRLTGKYNKSNPPPDDRRFGKISLDELEAMNTLLKEIGDAHGGKTCAQVALNWVVSIGNVGRNQIVLEIHVSSVVVDTWISNQSPVYIIATDFDLSILSSILFIIERYVKERFLL